MSKTRFSIAYDGPAVESGAMDVRDLAPALLAVGQLFDAANSVLNEQRTTIGVNVQATAHDSFEVVLEVVQGTAQQLVGVFGGAEVTAALQLKELVLLGIGGASGTGGLVWLIKRLRGRNPRKLEKIDADRVRITVGSETIEIPIKLLRLYEDIPVRTALERLVKEPLKREGMETFEVRQDGSPVQAVSRQESEYFSRPEIPDEVLVEDTRTAAFSIVSLAFKEDNKWRLHDGNASISALIIDQGFLYKVDTNQIAFAKGDVLICEVRMTQTRDGNGLRTEYVVQRVLEHKPAWRQMGLRLESDDEGEAS